MLHIGKTGGSAVRHALRASELSADVVMHGHDATLRDVPVGDHAVFLVRDPVRRFVSGFNSRLRKGAPRTYNEWTAAEARAFARFKTANALASGLCSDHDEVRSAALVAMDEIYHPARRLAFWLVSADYVIKRRDDILFIGATESLDQDFHILSRLLGATTRVPLPADPIGRHATPAGHSVELDADARHAIEAWYEDDQPLYRTCLEIRAEIIESMSSDTRLDQNAASRSSACRERAVRSLSDEEANALPPGADHYRAYVGPASEYDQMGATQFALLWTLGLRGHHRLLDFGCGSLRCGRLLIPYLDRGNYYGLEPNSWLVEEGLEKHLGRDILSVKQPSFFSFDDFRADRCGTEFDFIVAQSILSHTGPDLTKRSLQGFARAIKPEGLIVLTVVHTQQTGGAESYEDGWRYPDCHVYTPETIRKLIEAANLHGRPIPWFHPRQTWYVLATSPDRIPPPAADTVLRGAMIDNPAWRATATE